MNGVSEEQYSDSDELSHPEKSFMFEQNDVNGIIGVKR